MSGAMTAKEEVFTENSPSVPPLVAVRNTSRTQSSVTKDVNFTAKSAIRLPHLHKEVEKQQYTEINVEVMCKLRKELQLLSYV